MSEPNLPHDTQEALGEALGAQRRAAIAATDGALLTALEELCAGLAALVALGSLTDTRLTALESGKPAA